MESLAHLHERARDAAIPSCNLVHEELLKRGVKLDPAYIRKIEEIIVTAIAAKFMDDEKVSGQQKEIEK